MSWIRSEEGQKDALRGRGNVVGVREEAAKLNVFLLEVQVEIIKNYQNYL